MVTRPCAREVAMALTGGLFDGVEDTPFLRARLRELEQDADVLRDRSSRLTRDCRAYRDALEDAYASEVNFQESVRSLYGSIDDAFGKFAAGGLDRLDRTFNECVRDFLVETGFDNQQLRV